MSRYARPWMQQCRHCRTCWQWRTLMCLMPFSTADLRSPLNQWPLRATWVSWISPNDEPTNRRLRSSTSLWVGHVLSQKPYNFLNLQECHWYKFLKLSRQCNFNYFLMVTSTLKDFHHVFHCSTALYIFIYWFYLFVASCYLVCEVRFFI